MKRRTIGSALCCLLLAAGFLTSPAGAADEVKVGMLRLPTALFVGMEKGYFAAENITVTPVFFRGGGELIPSLSVGQIDVASTSPGAALFNAMASGVNAKIVADYWTIGKERSGDSAYIVARKDLVTSGKLKSPKDAKGMTIAITARGQMTELFANSYLASGGLTQSNVRIVVLPLPDMVAALNNKAVDLISAIDPYPTLAVDGGTGAKVASLSTLMPGLVQAVLMYGDRMENKDRSLGMRFMRAFSKSNLYIRAHLDPAGRAELAKIYQKYIPIDNPELYERVGLAVGPEKLTPVIEGKYALRWQMEQYVRNGDVKIAPDMRKAIDPAFADAAARAK